MRQIITQKTIDDLNRKKSEIDAELSRARVQGQNYAPVDDETEKWMTNKDNQVGMRRYGTVVSKLQQQLTHTAGWQFHPEGANRTRVYFNTETGPELMATIEKGPLGGTLVNGRALVPSMTRTGETSYRNEAPSDALMKALQTDAGRVGTGKQGYAMKSLLEPMRNVGSEFNRADPQSSRMPVQTQKEVFWGVLMKRDVDNDATRYDAHQWGLPKGLATDNGFSDRFLAHHLAPTIGGSVGGLVNKAGDVTTSLSIDKFFKGRKNWNRRISMGEVANLGGSRPATVPLAGETSFEPRSFEKAPYSPERVHRANMAYIPDTGLFGDAILGGGRLADGSVKRDNSKFLQMNENQLRKVRAGQLLKSFGVDSLSELAGDPEKYKTLFAQGSEAGLTSADFESAIHIQTGQQMPSNKRYPLAEGIHLPAGRQPGWQRTVTGYSVDTQRGGISVQMEEQARLSDIDFSLKMGGNKGLVHNVGSRLNNMVRQSGSNARDNIDFVIPGMRDPGAAAVSSLRVHTKQELLAMAAKYEGRKGFKAGAAAARHYASGGVIGKGSGIKEIVTGESRRLRAFGKMWLDNYSTSFDAHASLNPRQLSDMAEKGMYPQRYQQGGKWLNPGENRQSYMDMLGQAGSSGTINTQWRMNGVLAPGSANLREEYLGQSFINMEELNEMGHGAANNPQLAKVLGMYMQEGRAEQKAPMSMFEAALSNQQQSPVGQFAEQSPIGVDELRQGASGTMARIMESAKASSLDANDPRVFQRLMLESMQGDDRGFALPNGDKTTYLPSAGDILKMGGESPAGHELANPMFGRMARAIGMASFGEGSPLYLDKESGQPVDQEALMGQINQDILGNPETGAKGFFDSDTTKRGITGIKLPFGGNFTGHGMTDLEPNQISSGYQGIAKMLGISPKEAKEMVGRGDKMTTMLYRRPNQQGGVPVNLVHQKGMGRKMGISTYLSALLRGDTDADFYLSTSAMQRDSSGQLKSLIDPLTNEQVYAGAKSSTAKELESVQEKRAAYAKTLQARNSKQFELERQIRPLESKQRAGQISAAESKTLKNLKAQFGRGEKQLRRFAVEGSQSLVKADAKATKMIGLGNQMFNNTISVNQQAEAVRQNAVAKAGMGGAYNELGRRMNSIMDIAGVTGADPRRDLIKNFSEDVYQNPLDLKNMGVSEKMLMDVLRTANAAKFGGVSVGNGADAGRGQTKGEFYHNMAGLENRMFEAGIGMVRESDDPQRRAQQVAGMFSPSADQGVIDKFAGIFGGEGETSDIIGQLQSAYSEHSSNLSTSYDRLYDGGDERSMIHRNAAGQFALRGAKKMQSDPSFGGRNATLKEVLATHGAVLQQREAGMTDEMWSSAHEAEIVNQLKTAQSKHPTLEAIKHIVTEGKGPISNMLRSITGLDVKAMRAGQHAEFNAGRPYPTNRPIKTTTSGVSTPHSAPPPLPPSGNGGSGEPPEMGGSYVGMPPEDDDGHFHLGNSGGGSGTSRPIRTGGGGGGGGGPYVTHDQHIASIQMMIDQKNPGTGFKSLRKLENEASTFQKIMTQTGEALGLGTKAAMGFRESLVELNKHVESGGKLTKEQAAQIDKIYKQATRSDTSLLKMRPDVEQSAAGNRFNKEFGSWGQKTQYQMDFDGLMRAKQDSQGNVELGPLEKAARHAKLAKLTGSYAESEGGAGAEGSGAGEGVLNKINRTLGMNMFFARRAWGFTGGQVVGAMKEYSAYSNLYAQNAAQSGVDITKIDGPYRQTHNSQNAFQSMRLGMGQAGWDVWGSMLRGISQNTSDMGRSTMGGRAAAIGLPALGVGMGTALMSAPFLGALSPVAGLIAGGATAAVGTISAMANKDNSAFRKLQDWRTIAKADPLLQDPRLAQRNEILDHPTLGNIAGGVLQGWKDTFAGSPRVPNRNEEANFREVRASGMGIRVAEYENGVRSLNTMNADEQNASLLDYQTQLANEQNGITLTPEQASGLQRQTLNLFGGKTTPLQNDKSRESWRAQAAMDIDPTEFLRQVAQVSGLQMNNIDALEKLNQKLVDSGVSNDLQKQDRIQRGWGSGGAQYAQELQRGQGGKAMSAQRSLDIGEQFYGLNDLQKSGMISTEHYRNQLESTTPGLMGSFKGILGGIGAAGAAGDLNKQDRLQNISGFMQSIAERGYAQGNRPGQMAGISKLFGPKGINDKNAEWMMPQMQSILGGDQWTISKLAQSGQIGGSFGGVSLQTQQMGGGSRGSRIFSDFMKAPESDRFIGNSDKFLDKLSTAIPDSMRKGMKDAMTAGKDENGIWHGGQQGLTEMKFKMESNWMSTGFGWEKSDMARKTALATGRGSGWDQMGVSQDLRVSDRQLQSQQMAIRREQFEFNKDQGKQDNKMQIDQFMEKWGFNMQKMMTTFKWSAQDMSTDRSHQLTQRGWQQQDASFQRSSSQLEFGWQMEDYDRNIRMSRGRDRLNLMRNQERDVVRFGMQQGQMDQGDQRRKQIAKWEDEQFQKEKDRLNQKQEWGQQEMEMEKSQFMDRMGREQQRFDMGIQWDQQLLNMDELKFKRDVQVEDFEIKLQEQRMAQTQAYQASLQALAGAELAISEEIAAREAAVSDWIHSMLDDTSLLVALAAELGAALAGANVPPPDTGGGGGGGGYGPPPKAMWSGGYVQQRGALKGFANGGFTGYRGKYTPAGEVHGGEWVVPQEGSPVIRGDNGKMVELTGEVIQILRDISSALGEGTTKVYVSTSNAGNATDGSLVKGVKGMINK